MVPNHLHQPPLLQIPHTNFPITPSTSQIPTKHTYTQYTPLVYALNRPYDLSRAEIPFFDGPVFRTGEKDLRARIWVSVELEAVDRIGVRVRCAASLKGGDTVGGSEEAIV